MVSLGQLTCDYVNHGRKRFSAAIRPRSALVGGQIAQSAGSMTVVPYAREPLSLQATDLVRRIARMVLDEPADLMAEVQAAVSAAADEPLRSQPVLAAEVAASTRANVLHWAASMEQDPAGRVPANLTPEVLGIAREAFRRHSHIAPVAKASLCGFGIDGYRLAIEGLAALLAARHKA